MTSKEAYEKLAGEPTGVPDLDAAMFKLFEDGWKAALDEAKKHCEDVILADTVGTDEGLIHNAAVDHCIKAIGDLK